MTTPTLIHPTPDGDFIIKHGNKELVFYRDVRMAKAFRAAYAAALQGPNASEAAAFYFAQACAKDKEVIAGYSDLPDETFAPMAVEPTNLLAIACPKCGRSDGMVAGHWNEIGRAHV